jgi:hypothetical protein
MTGTGNLTKLVKSLECSISVMKSRGGKEESVKMMGKEEKQR